MEIICSKTGSDGNFSVIYDGKTYIGIDCGINYFKANKLSGYRMVDLKGVLVTHVHLDHAGYLKHFMTKSVQIYAAQSLWDGMEISKGYDHYKHVFSENQFELGTFVIKPFKVPHTNSDGSECDNHGFLIYSKETKEKMLWITDCAYITNKFPACDYICIECNYVDIEDYSQEVQYTNMAVEARRVKSHLSLNRCLNFIKKQDLSRIKYVKLLHLSRSQGIIEDVIRERFKEEFPNLEVRI